MLVLGRSVGVGARRCIDWMGDFVVTRVSSAAAKGVVDLGGSSVVDGERSVMVGHGFGGRRFVFGCLRPRLGDFEFVNNYVGFDAFWVA
jgi:hypothetical protein